ncbi:MAG: hypothetical protein ACI4M3_03555 [Acutalibacteraceae bacterium]
MDYISTAVFLFMGEPCSPFLNTWTVGGGEPPLAKCLWKPQALT